MWLKDQLSHITLKYILNSCGIDPCRQFKDISLWHFCLHPNRMEVNEISFVVLMALKNTFKEMHHYFGSQNTRSAAFIRTNSSIESTGCELQFRQVRYSCCFKMAPHTPLHKVQNEIWPKEVPPKAFALCICLLF